MRLSLRDRPGSDGVAATPLIAVVAALILLIVSLLLGVQNEQARRAERVRGTQVQSDVLARSVAAPLAFDDIGTINEYLTALKANPAIRAVGAYEPDGRLAAGFTRTGTALPASVAIASANDRQGDIVVTAPVMQNGTRLGMVYLRASTESWARRAARYVGIAIVVIMASLLIAALGIAYASISRAHRQLREQTAQRERAEEALRQSQKMEAMGQLTGGVAHDFNNLLMVASSGLDLLDRTSDPARRERLKQGIRQAIDRGAKLTQQLLTFARKSPLKPEVVDIERTVRGLQDLLERSLRENISVAMHFAADLCPVEIDVSQFEVAVLNIALNARDAMPDGGIIQFALDRVPGSDEGSERIRVSIADSGVGIAAGDLQKVFEPFFTTKGVGRGTGLGLSQVYGFARSSGGDVRIESEIGRGTTISLLLPCSSKPLPISVTVAQELAAPATAHRILLVEDDDSVAELVGEMLGELGYAYLRAPNAQAALDQLMRDDRFDLVFSDMVMPGTMSGLDLARAIAARWPVLKIVLTTGYSEAAASALAEGRELLTKPYAMHALSAKLSQLLEHADAADRHGSAARHLQAGRG